MKVADNMNKYIKKYKNIIIIVAILIVIVTTITIPKSRGYDKNMLSDTIVDNLLFSESSIENNILEVIVQNTTKEEYKLKTVTVTFYDSSNKVIASIPTYIGDSIEAEGYRKINVTTDLDLTKATKITYTINK